MVRGYIIVSIITNIILLYLLFTQEKGNRLVASDNGSTIDTSKLTQVKYPAGAKEVWQVIKRHPNGFIESVTITDQEKNIYNSISFYPNGFIKGFVQFSRDKINPETGDVLSEDQMCAFDSVGSISSFDFMKDFKTVGSFGYFE